MTSFAPKDIVVDVEAVARRVVADPRNSRVSTVEQVALCQWVVNRIEAPPLKASLAASLALAIAAYSQASQVLGPPAFNDAFQTLKTRFEEEFPEC
jgi:hypothetical protein